MKNKCKAKEYEDHSIATWMEIVGVVQRSCDLQWVYNFICTVNFINKVDGGIEKNWVKIGNTSNFTEEK